MKPRSKPLNSKGKAPGEASEKTRSDRCRGALLGLAVGEALGIPHETRHLVAPLFPEVCDGPLTEMRGGGRFELKRGQVSWGSMQATCLADTLKAHLAYDVQATGKAYAKWLGSAFDVDETTREALTQVLDGRTPEFTGRRVWLENHQEPADNAPLARTAPLGVFFARQRDLRIAASLADCAITHFAPLCQLACSTLNGLIAAAILTPRDRLEPAEIARVAEAELALAASTLGRTQPDWVQTVKDAADFLRADFKAAEQDDPLLYGPELHLFHKASFVRTSYRLALWELLHAPSFEAGLLDVVNRGGDADTNAAITGALLGAVHGEAAIPEDWRTEVLECVPRGEPALNTRYHPRSLVTLAGISPAAAAPAPAAGKR